MSVERVEAESRDVEAIGPGEVIAGKYRVLRALDGLHGRASYLARDTVLEREVVLTLGSTLSPAALARFEREARVLAKLSHPNVVVVHDIGEASGRTFVATEHVDGGTARAWLAQKPRTWREILALYLAAGEGLSAAHAEGIVHGDFGPEKVLVGEDERPRVGDFGVARSSDEEGAERAPLDPRADQLAFCRALWEALYGEPPSASTTAPSPRARAVPRRIERALRRGLSSSPEARWPSLAALLRALGAAAHGRGPALTIAIAIGVVLASVAAVLILGRREARAYCETGATELARVWNDQRAGAIGRAFEASGGAATWASLRPILDRQARSWIAMHRQTCSATRIEGVQPEGLMQRRMLCLAGARAQLDALLDTFAAADRSVVARAPQEVGLLDDLAACADVDALANQTPLPSDPAARAAIDRVYKDVALLRLTHLRDDQRDPIAAGDRAREDARAIGWTPLVANASWVRATLLLDAGKIELGRDGLKDAANLALAAGDNDTAASAMADLAWHYAEARRAEDAAIWLELARALWSFRGQSPALGYRILGAEALRDYALGKPKDMLAHRLEAIELGQRAYGQDPYFLANRHINLAGALQSNGRFDDAVREISLAIPAFEASFGAEHPSTARALRALAENEAQLGQYESANEHARQAVARLEAWYGLTDPRLVEALDTLAVVQTQRGDLTSARATYDREIRLFPAGDPRIPDTQSNLCMLEAMAGHDAEAVKYGEQALASHAQVLGPENPLLATDLINLGATYRHMGRLADSEPTLRRAVQIVDAGSGANHPDLVNPSIELGDTLVAMKRTEEAAAILARAIAIVESDAPVPPPLAADAYRAYAEALYPADRARARDAAIKARDRFGALGPDFEPKQKQVAAWLSRHP